MSWQARDFVKNSNRQKGARRLMLMGIADYADATTGEAFPSVASLAAYCNVSERQATYLLSKLEADGEITRRKRFRKTWIIRLVGYTPESYAQPVDNPVDNSNPAKSNAVRSNMVTPQDLAPLNGQLPRKTYPNNPAKSCALTLKEEPKELKQPKKRTSTTRTRTRARADAAPLSREATSILQQWWRSTPDTHRPAKCRDSERVIYTVKGWRAQAQALADRGVTTRNVSAFVAYWLEKRPGETLNFGNLANDILAWRKKEIRNGNAKLTQAEWMEQLSNSKYADSIE